MTKLYEKETFQRSAIDLLCGGTPCFTADTTVLTKSGVKYISQIGVGEMVLTHKLRWKPVLKVGVKLAETVTLKGHGHAGIETTPEHPFYAHKKKRLVDETTNKKTFMLDGSPEWVEAKDMAGLFWGLPTCGESIKVPPIILKGNETHLPEMNNSFYWILGAWLGDGWTRITARRSYTIICADKNKHQPIADHLTACGLHASTSQERTTIRYQIASSALSKWIKENFNGGAKNKTIPAWLLYGTTREEREAFLSGYQFADGYVIYNGKKEENGFGFTTISPLLSTGIRLLGATLGYSVGEQLVKPNRTLTIEGRTVNESPFYQVRLHSNSRTTIVENEIAWQKVKKYTPNHAIKPVFNIEVADDNSYVAGGIIVHNCQSFSVSGLRKGLDDERGNLALEFIRVAAIKRPRWIVWENVPGVLSSKGGRDFATFLGGLTGRTINPPRGGWKNSGLIDGIPDAYGVAWTVLDAQYFGVAQRRRRVFVVGHLGDYRRAGSVLFERNCLQRHPAPSRETGKEAATVAAFSAGNSGDSRSVGYTEEGTPPLRAGSSGTNQVPTIVMSTGQANAEITVENSLTLNCNHEQPIIFQPKSETTFSVSNHTDVGEDIFSPLTRSGSRKANVIYGIDEELNVRDNAFGTLSKGGHGTRQAVAFRTAGDGSVYESGETVATLTTGTDQSANVVAFAQNTRDEVREMNVVGALAANPGMKQTSYIRQQMSVRRLMPVECEKLQGFPPGFTDIRPRGKPTADTPRYKALGNSMAVPVLLWIGQRIQMVDDILRSSGLIN